MRWFVINEFSLMGQVKNIESNYIILEDKSPNGVYNIKVDTNSVPTDSIKVNYKISVIGHIIADTNNNSILVADRIVILHT